MTRQQRVVLNYQPSNWAPVLARINTITLLLLIYTNDLPDNLESLAKLFADDLQKNSDWAFKWKMLFNHDVTKQAQEVIFSCKSSKTDRPVVYFNEAPVAKASCQKYLGMHLEEKLNFTAHIKEKIAKANKGIGIICKLTHLLPRESLLTLMFQPSHSEWETLVLRGCLLSSHLISKPLILRETCPSFSIFVKNPSHFPSQKNKPRF